MGLIWDLETLAGGTQSGIEYDPIDDVLSISNSQDCEPTLKLNKQLFNDGTDGYGKTREWRRVASIPNIILEKWFIEEGIRYWDSADTAKLAAKLDDPEWRFLRTAPGKVSRKPIRTYCKASSGTLQ